MKAALNILLCAVLIVASLGFGAARGQARVAGEMVLCTGAMMVTVAVDRDGQPVEKALICPDMALSLLAATGDAPDVALIRAARAADLPRSARVLRGRDAPKANARGPPAVIV
ncbi:MAG: hypothetical protein Q4G36_11325 [Paracoccus sp. (in: a-proteobacteria)]|nr:hypothetical protein [Paracoccus sp. (in: a-proteobacteria)]